MDTKTLQRFWSKVDKDGPVPAHRPELGPCWVWTASTRNGYGQFYLDGDNLVASRVSWAITHGHIPDGLHALHDCDNRPCVNPEHLFLGSIADNNADMHRKGRGFVPPVRVGEAHENAKLTELQVLNIRRRYAAGGITQQALADEHGVKQAYVSAIVLRKKWTHLPEVRA